MYRILVLVFALTGVNLHARSFSSLFDEFLGGAETSEEVRQFVNENHYVLVTGFLNERTPFYWDDTITALKDMGVSSEQISILYPASANTIFKNSEILKKQMEALPTQKPLVILSHSKGAVETFSFAWRNPEFVKLRVKGLFFIQGAFGGSHIADHLYTGELSIDSEMPLADRLTMNLQFYFERALLVGYKRPLYDLTTLVSARRQEDVLLKKQDIHKEIDNRIFFVTSFEKPQNYSFYLRNAGKFLHTYHGENDGLLLTKQQSIGSVGKTIANIQADHCDIVISHPISKRHKEFRFAFTNALVSWLRVQVRTGQLY